MKQHAREWDLISPSQWLAVTVKRGYTLEFTEKPPAHSLHRETHLPDCAEKRELLEAEIDALRSKGAIVPVFPPSTFILAPKETGVPSSI